MGIIIVDGGVEILQGQITVESYAPFVPEPLSGYALWVWGINANGNLGDGTVINRSSPVQIGALSDWAKVNTGGGSTLTIKTDRSLWAWGHNFFGNVGDGTTIDKSSPIQIGSDTDWDVISVAVWEAHAIKTDGTLWAWGQNQFAAIGDGTVIDRSSPVQIGALTDWAKLGSEGRAPHAIKTDGTLWGWGRGYAGQIGDGTIIDKSSPVQIGVLTDWEIVTSGNNNQIFAVKTGGSLWAWGNNFGGKLGLGDIADRSSPVQIGILTDWTSVSAGTTGHTIALKTNGTLWAWGVNTFGTLGQNDVIDRSSPVQIGSLTNWASIIAGGNSSCFARKNDGTIWAWGRNPFGQLGDETIVSKSSPIQIGSLTTWTNISAGGAHAAALKPA